MSVKETVLFAAQGGCCFYCGKRLTLKSATRDHFFPKSGGHSLSNNKVFSCVDCNGKKGARLPTEKEVDRYMRLNREIEDGFYRRKGAGSSWKRRKSR